MRKYILPSLVLALALATAVPASAASFQFNWNDRNSRTGTSTGNYQHGTSTPDRHDNDRDRRDNDRDRNNHNWDRNGHNNQNQNHRQPWTFRGDNHRNKWDRNSWGWDNFRFGRSQNITASGNIRYTAGDLDRTAVFSMKSNRGNNDRGTGYFNYRDADGNWYRVNVKYVASSDREVYFAGPVVSASDSSWTGYWLYAKVRDMRFGGQIWGSFTDREDAISNFDSRNIADPSDGPFRAFGSINVRITR